MAASAPRGTGGPGWTAGAVLLSLGVLGAGPERSAFAFGLSDTTVDRVAIVVEGFASREREPQVATLWDLFVAASLDVLREEGPAASGVPLTANRLRASQRRLVEQLVALREAVRLQRDSVPPDLVNEARDRLAERIGGHDALRSYLRERSVSMEAMDEALRREVVVERFTESSVRLAADLDTTALRARWDEGHHPFVGQGFEEVQLEFAEWLRRVQWEQRRREWLIDLRSRCRLSVFDVVSDLETGNGEAL